MMLRSRLSRCESRLEVRSVVLNTVRKEASEYSYMLVMADRPAMTKKVMAPRRATGEYLTRVTSISCAVTRDSASFRLISTALALALSSVSSSSMLSRMLPWLVASSLSSMSSRCLRSDLFSLISFTSFSRASSRSGRSFLTVTFSSCSRRPCSVTE